MTIPSPEGQRLPPAMPVQAYKTYTLASPTATHFRPATCEEVACPNFLNGFRTRLDERTEQGMALAHYIRKESGRRFTEDRDDTGLTVFTFEPGQRCFNSADHKLPLQRPEICIVRGGDWRGNPTGQVVKHRNLDDWVEDFALHQQDIADRINRG